MLLNSLQNKITMADCQRIIEEADVDGNGNLDITEFIEWATRIPKMTKTKNLTLRSRSRKERKDVWRQPSLKARSSIGSNDTSQLPDYEDEPYQDINSKNDDTVSFMKS